MKGDWHGWEKFLEHPAKTKMGDDCNCMVGWGAFGGPLLANILPPSLSMHSGRNWSGQILISRRITTPY